MSDEQPPNPSPPPRRGGLERGLAALLTGVMIAAEIIVIDQVTGRHLANAVSLTWARVKAGAGPDEPVIPPAAITALHNEARRITREAARDARHES